MTLKHSGPTDKVHQVKLDSSLQRVTWERGGASIGSTVGMIVETCFVGDGAKVDFTVYSQDNATLGSASGTVYGDSCVAKVEVPEDAGEWIYFLAELKGHGLEDVSGWLKVRPRRTVLDAEWDRDVVHRGETVTLTVRTEGIPDRETVKITILEHDADGSHDVVAAFDSLVRGNRVEVKWEFQYVEDTDDIATAQEAEAGYSWPELFFRAEHESSMAESAIMKFEDWLQLACYDDWGTPRAGEKFEVEFADGSTQSGSLDDEGEVVLEKIPPGPFSVRLPDLEPKSEHARAPQLRSRVHE